MEYRIVTVDSEGETVHRRFGDAELVIGEWLRIVGSATGRREFVWAGLFRVREAGYRRGDGQLIAQHTRPTG